MKRQIIFNFIVFIFLFALIINPQSKSFAQGGCFDPSGGPIPCPPTATEETDDEENNRRTATPIPPTFTFTPTSTFTPTATQTPSPTFTSTNTPTLTFTPTFTSTPSVTPTVTPYPASQVVLPGIGIGMLILFLIIGILFPIIQRIRVARRGY